MMADRDSLIRRIAFTMLHGITPRNARDVLARTGGVDAYFEMPARRLAECLGCVNRLTGDEERRRALEAAKRECAFVESKSIDTAFITDDNYPRRLSMCDDAPVMIYSVGSRAALDADVMLAIVGTRNATRYGIDFTQRLVSDLNKKLNCSLTIVSGLAYGIDVAAHKAALDSDVPTIGVVAHGLNTIYPADHRDIAHRICRRGGGVVTEYTSGSSVNKGNFLARNRIVAGLCDAVIVVESDSRGGSLVTAGIASAYDRQVFALPGRITDRYSRGCNKLIANHAADMVRDADDLINMMQWPVKPEPGEQTALKFEIANPQFDAVISHLREHPDDTVSDLSAALGMPYAEINARLMEMEMENLLTICPGSRISLNV